MVISEQRMSTVATMWLTQRDMLLLLVEPRLLFVCIETYTRGIRIQDHKKMLTYQSGGGFAPTLHI